MIYKINTKFKEKSSIITFIGYPEDLIIIDGKI